MSSTPSWKHFKLIHIHSGHSEYTDIYVLKENENVIRFEIICKNNDMVPSGPICMRSNTI